MKLKWKQCIVLFTLIMSSVVLLPHAQDQKSLVNPNIDMDGYIRISSEAARYRISRRVSEEDFIEMSRKPGTIILDARSREKYQTLHIKGAINLSFPDITIESLKATIPDKNTRILIYCNNNFLGDRLAFPTKLATASLNLSTYIALYTYGYRNIYELAPLTDIGRSKLEFEGTGRTRPSTVTDESAPARITLRKVEPAVDTIENE